MPGTLVAKVAVSTTSCLRSIARPQSAIGDINTYPGRRKLIVCGFHEATLAAFAAAEALSGKPVALQYTTSSTRLHQLLRVGSAATVNG